MPAAKSPRICAGCQWPESADPVQVFRVRLVVRMTAPARVHAHHAAVLYSLLARAHGVSRRAKPCIPDGVLLDAPEQARLWLANGSRYAFGYTLLSTSAGEAGRLTDLLVRGLRIIGRRQGPDRIALGGNFEVEVVHDLVAGETHRPGHPLQPIAREWIEEEVRRVGNLRSLTLRFISPLRAHRSKQTRCEGHQFIDREHFPPPAFLRRLVARLQGLGIDLRGLEKCGTGRHGLGVASPNREDTGDDWCRPESQPTVAENRFVWLDLSYGPRHIRKALGGAVGRVTLTNVNPAAIEALVWGQYVRIGEATRFGFGQYRIEELGPCPFACARGTDLLTLAAEHPGLDESAAKCRITSGAARTAARQLAAGIYTARPHFCIEIPKADGRCQLLPIPGRLDLVLQHAMLDFIAPALNLFREESSLGYRHGLGHHTAVRRLKTAFAEGFRWALRADLLDFHNTLEHSPLRERIAAYVADDALTDALMQWVKSGSPHIGHGLPAVSPLSQVLAALFLDALDEAMERLGRRLVRYVDDFFILFRERAEAESVFAEARYAAHALQLALNRDKTRSLAQCGPFEFLGFRFEPRDSWGLAEPDGPQPLEKLGWK